MELREAIEVAALELEKSKIVVILSNKSVWNLDNESEIEAVKEYAKNNKLELFVVKNESTKEVVKETKKTK